MRPLILILFACFFAAAAAAEKSVFWMPYREDPATVGLYHLDKATPEAAEDLLAPEGGAADDEARNAIPTGLPALLEGAAEPVGEGRFGDRERLAQWVQMVRERSAAVV
ncbi:MAG: hypothetical protein BWY76_02212 [bacterium ADurb.Bin429]|nr:MAG: hypothetical protein BWY76_02212 [bacterium ADurb.Bin429]